MQKIAPNHLDDGTRLNNISKLVSRPSYAIPNLP